ncbi:MAG TPA: alpha/beta hydrolase [Puia sp.]|jgi:pimeloyl-ACP methyl ester carboxylesterase
MKRSFHASLALTALVLFSCNNAGTNSAASDATAATSDSTPAAAQKIGIADQGVNIDYTDAGKGDTTLLFVHGWGINQTYWNAQVAFFSPRYRVVTVDLPGFGQSGKNREDWGPLSFARDVDTVMARLNLKNVILVGHSMSGHIVLQSAIDIPGRVIGLVGVDNFKTVGQKQTPQAKKEFAAAIEKMKHHFKPVVTDFFGKGLFSANTPDSIKKRVLNDAGNTDSVLGVASIQQMGDFDEVQKLTMAQRKLSLVNSDYQPTDTTGLKAHHIPYEIFIVHGTGHYPMIEKPDEFNARLQEAISKL